MCSCLAAAPEAPKPKPQPKAENPEKPKIKEQLEMNRGRKAAQLPEGAMQLIEEEAAADTAEEAGAKDALRMQAMSKQEEAEERKRRAQVKVGSP